VAKHAGELVIADRWGKEPRSNILLYSVGDYLRESGHTVDSSGRDLYPVHRLDRETSGIVLFAKNQNAHKQLSQYFENRKVEKKYFALAVDCPEWDFAEVRVPLKRAEGKSGRGRALVDLRGKNLAHTEFFVKERYGDLALIEAHPHTGKLHQIRLHLRILGHPLFRDPDYGFTRWHSKSHQNVPFGNMWLHAAQIIFPSLTDANKKICIDCPIPSGIRKNLDSLFKAGE
jgi:23S rRNA pseudouridine955/2504/2580 synthase/23S rRNA pseudouridine1911/1915/1917 synthase